MGAARTGKDHSVEVGVVGSVFSVDGESPFSVSDTAVSVESSCCASSTIHRYGEWRF